VIRLFLVLAIILDLVSVSSANAEEMLIIANLSVDLEASLTPRQIESIYLLRMTVWPNGDHIIPVNREITSEIRAEFTSAVLQQDNASLVAYWNEMHFQGKLPPLVQESESALLAFVQKVPGAIGYISASTPAIGVRVLSHVP